MASGARSGEKPTVGSSVKAFNDDLNDELLQKTREVWQSRLGRDLSRDEAKQITANIAGFFSTLAEWERSERPVPANGWPGDAASESDGERRGR